MEQQNYQYQDNSVFVQESSVSKKFFASVFTWMFVALGLSFASAYYLQIVPEAMSYFKNPITLGPSPMGYIAIFAPFGLALLMGAGMRKFSYLALIGIFLVYSLLTGVMLAFVLFNYTSTSIAITFLSACIIFGVMAVMGYTTNIDLSQFRSILMAGIIGLIVVSLVNMFLLGSSTLDYILSFVGVAIFTALTAFKVQEIKRIGEGLDENGNFAGDADGKKLALIGALSLYITFLNLFLSLLRIFGGRK